MAQENSWLPGPVLGAHLSPGLLQLWPQVSLSSLNLLLSLYSVSPTTLGTCCARLQEESNSGPKGGTRHCLSRPLGFFVFPQEHLVQRADDSTAIFLLALKKGKERKDSYMLSVLCF